MPEDCFKKFLTKWNRIEKNTLNNFLQNLQMPVREKALQETAGCFVLFLVLVLSGRRKS